MLKYSVGSILVLFLSSCSPSVFINCAPRNYFVSNYHNENSTLQSQQRELITNLSEQELELTFPETTMSCKEVLTNFFFCNICFNNNSNYLIPYNGTKINLEPESSPHMFTKNVIELIRSMQIGSIEYENFINHINKN